MRVSGCAWSYDMQVETSQLLCNTPPLQDLGVCDACVGHVCVDPAAAMPAWAGPCTACDRLIVAHALIAKGEVVHAALQEGGKSAWRSRAKETQHVRKVIAPMCLLLMCRWMYKLSVADAARCVIIAPVLT